MNENDAWGAHVAVLLKSRSIGWQTNRLNKPNVSPDRNNNRAATHREPVRTAQLVWGGRGRTRERNLTLPTLCPSPPPPPSPSPLPLSPPPFPSPSPPHSIPITSHTPHAHTRLPQFLNLKMAVLSLGQFKCVLLGWTCRNTSTLWANKPAWRLSAKWGTGEE